jgi:hypothetical protein
MFVAEAARIEESTQGIGDLVIDVVTAAAERMTQGWDLARVAGGDATVEVDIAVPFRVKVHVGSPDPEKRMPPGTVCCVCTRSSDGVVRCWNRDPGCC